MHAADRTALFHAPAGKLACKHSAQAGEAVSAIAERYGMAEADILNYPLNELTGPEALEEGQQLVVANDRKELVRPTPQALLDTPFAWPLVGRLIQRFLDEHRAINIGAP